MNLETAKRALALVKDIINGPCTVRERELAEMVLSLAGMRLPYAGFFKVDPSIDRLADIDRLRVKAVDAAVEQSEDALVEAIDPLVLHLGGEPATPKLRGLGRLVSCDALTRKIYAAEFLRAAQRAADPERMTYETAEHISTTTRDQLRRKFGGVIVESMREKLACKDPELPRIVETYLGV